MILCLPQSFVPRTDAGHYSSLQLTSQLFCSVLSSVWIHPFTFYWTITHFCIMNSLKLIEDFCLLLYFSVVTQMSRTLLQPLDWLIPGCKVQGNGQTWGWIWVLIQAGRMQSNSFYQQEMFSRLPAPCGCFTAKIPVSSTDHQHLQPPERHCQSLCFAGSFLPHFWQSQARTSTTVLLMALLDFIGNAEGCRLVFNVWHNFCPAVGLIFLLGMRQ